MMSNYYQVKEITKTEYFSIYSIKPGVYAAIAYPGKGAWSNAGFVDLGDDLIVFDALSTPSAAYELRKQAEGITGKKVKYLVNSHHHGDHTFGNQVFEDTIIISSAMTHQLSKDKNTIGDLETEQREMKKYLIQLQSQVKASKDEVIKYSLLNQYNEMSKILEHLPRLRMVLPSLLFEEKLVIEGAKRRVELHCLGGGHTARDTFMYLPDDKVVFMGDLLTENLHLPIYDPESFLTIINKVKQKDIEVFVPGHGAIGNELLLDELISYLSFLIESGKEAQSLEKSLEQFIEELKVPDQYKHWKGTKGIKGNLEQVYKFYSES